MSRNDKRLPPTGGLPPGAAGPPPSRMPPCGGMFNVLFGQCCVNPSDTTESELREPAPGSAGTGQIHHQQHQTPPPQQHAHQHLNQHSHAHQQREQPLRGEGDPSMRGVEGPPRGGLDHPSERRHPEKHDPARPAELRRYLIDNTTLKINGPPGIAYRYTKDRKDKVRSDVKFTVAKWGDIVTGIDQSDGWLKVGDLYLPMMHEGFAVITPQPNSGVDNPNRDRSPMNERMPRTVAGSGVTRPPPTSDGTHLAALQKECPPEFGKGGSTMDKVAALVKNPAVIVENKVGNKVENKSEHPAEGNASKRCQELLAGGIPKLVPTPVAPKPTSLLEPNISKASAKVSENACGPHTAGQPHGEVDWPDLFSKRVISAEQGDMDVHLRQPDKKWVFLPSVGTWLSAVVEKSICDEAASDALKATDRGADIIMSTCAPKFHVLPSVGTWLLRPRKRNIGADAHKN